MESLTGTERWPAAGPLATERLDLEPVRAGHAREMTSVLAAPALYRFTGGGPPTEQALETRFDRQSAGVSPDGLQGWLNWVVRKRSDRRAAGIVQATVTGQGDDMTADLSWVVGVEHQVSGVATEAASAVLSSLHAAGVRAFTAHVRPDNAASAAVARRLGMVPTTLREDGETRWATMFKP